MNAPKLFLLLCLFSLLMACRERPLDPIPPTAAPAVMVSATATAAPTAIAPTATKTIRPSETPLPPTEPPAPTAVQERVPFIEIDAPPTRTAVPTPKRFPTLAIIVKEKTATAAPSETPRPVWTATPLPSKTNTPQPIWTATSTPVDTPTPQPAWTATSTPVDTPAPQPAWTATPTPIDTPTPLPTETPFVPLDCTNRWFFTPGLTRECPFFTSQMTASQQEFERGYLLWMEGRNEIIVLPKDGTVLCHTVDFRLVFRDTFDAAVDPIDDPTFVPPDGYLQPQYGFGKVWRNNESLRTYLGWAVAAPHNFQTISHISHVRLDDSNVRPRSHIKLADGRVARSTVAGCMEIAPGLTSRPGCSVVVEPSKPAVLVCEQ